MAKTGQPKTSWVFVGFAAVAAAGAAVSAWLFVDEAVIDGSPLRELSARIGPRAAKPGLRTATVVGAHACRVRIRGSKGWRSDPFDIHDGARIDLDQGAAPSSLEIAAEAPIVLGEDDLELPASPLPLALTTRANAIPRNPQSTLEVSCPKPGSVVHVLACERGDGRLGPCGALSFVLLTPEDPSLYLRARAAGAKGKVGIFLLAAVTAAIAAFASRSSEREVFSPLAKGVPKLGTKLLAVGFVSAIVSLISVSLATLCLLAAAVTTAAASIGVVLRMVEMTRARGVLKAPSPEGEVEGEVSQDAQTFDLPGFGAVAYARVKLFRTRRGQGAQGVELLDARRAPDLLVTSGGPPALLVMTDAEPDGVDRIECRLDAPTVHAVAAALGVAAPTIEASSPAVSAHIELLRVGDPILAWVYAAGTRKVVERSRYRGDEEVQRFDPIAPQALFVGRRATLLQEVARERARLVVTLVALAVTVGVCIAALAWVSHLTP